MANNHAGSVGVNSPQRAAWRQQVFELDGYRCQCCQRATSLGAHHIKYLSQGGKDIVKNGITLCMFCHAPVHVGDGSGDNRRTGREIMIGILGSHAGDPNFRWGAALEELKRKEKL